MIDINAARVTLTYGHRNVRGQITKRVWVNDYPESWGTPTNDRLCRWAMLKTFGSLANPNIMSCSFSVEQ